MPGVLTLLTDPPIEDGLRELAESSSPKLIDFRTKAELNDGTNRDETVIPPSLDQLRSFLHGLVAGMCFARGQLGSNWMPQKLEWTDDEIGHNLFGWDSEDGRLFISNRLTLIAPGILYRKDQAERRDHFGFIGTYGNNVGFRLTGIAPILSSMACWESSNLRGRRGTSRLQHLCQTIKGFNVAGATGARTINNNGFVDPRTQVPSTKLATLIRKRPELVGMAT